jgi:hypothetical protein
VCVLPRSAVHRKIPLETLLQLSHIDSSVITQAG